MGIEILDKLLGTVCGKTKDDHHHEPLMMSDPKKIKGTVVLKKKNLMDTTNVGASFLDRVHEIFGKGVSIQLISSSHVEQTKNGKRGKLGKEAFLEDWVTKITSLINSEDEATFDVNFEWDDEGFGCPGAFIVKNHHHSEFYLKTLTIEDVPGHGKIHFVCDSWVYPTKRYNYDRIFFANKTYLRSQTPEALLWYREQELRNLRGENHVGEGMLKEWDRVYDYAYYNDLGMPEKGKDSARPVLGGSQEYPYPRRTKTGRKPNKKDSKTESRLFLLSLDIYVPRDERFTQVKFSDFIGYAAKSIGQVLGPEIRALFDKTINEFDTFEDVMKLYEGGASLPGEQNLEKIRKCIPWELLRELARSDGEKFLKLPIPDVIKGDKTAWRTDEEFGREMLAGVNPVIISLLKEFPPTSKLDPEVYGNQNSTMTKAHVEKNMNGLTVEDALETNKLFILDHHDALMPYLRRINTNTPTKTYASRTVLLLQDDGTLKALAIELSKPHEDGDSHGAVSQVFTPCDYGIEGSIWQLAKAYAAINDSGYHQLISHWLNTHAVIEPFVIATNRQLSAIHPIHKLLKPHFRDTANINALARQILINAGGVLETTVYPGRYAMEMSSAVYKSWDLTEQALPKDLIKRGMAVEDPTKTHGVRLTIEDYPYAVDGLEIWSAIRSWVREYVCLYYADDYTIKGDAELQSWWLELRNEGHGDIKDKPWWPKMETREELTETLTIVIWVASALHAAVNFGQYSYAGYLPNRPTVSRRFMPEEGSPEYAELAENPELAFLKTITAQFQTLLGVSLIEILSRHSADEVYLGQRVDGDWTDDHRAVEAFKKFGASLIEIETKILERNRNKELKNRNGPVDVPYRLLYPNTSDTSKESGLNVWGIPNSISM